MHSVHKSYSIINDRITFMANKLSKDDKLALDMLNEAATTFSSPDGATSFIDHVMTEGERVAIGRRIAVARMILSGQTYFEICEQLHISPNTFRNIRKWIYEELPGYNQVIEDNKKEEVKKADERAKRSFSRTQPFTFTDLSRRYPGHFLLFNIAGSLLSSNESTRRSKRKRSIRKLK